MNNDNWHWWTWILMLKTHLESIDLTDLDLPWFPEDSIVISCQVSEFVRSVRHFGPNLPVGLSLRGSHPYPSCLQVVWIWDFSDLVGFGEVLVGIDRSLMSSLSGFFTAASSTLVWSRRGSPLWCISYNLQQHGPDLCCLLSIKPFCTEFSKIVTPIRVFPKIGVPQNGWWK